MQCLNAHLHDKWMAYIHDPFPFHYYPRPYNWVEPGYDRKNFFSGSYHKKHTAFPSPIIKRMDEQLFFLTLLTQALLSRIKFKIRFQNTSFSIFFDISKFNLLHAGNLMKQRSLRVL
jgi:hypothetical protein